MLHDPSARFVLSFFSPSGYDVFSTQSNIGEVVYLPWDIGSNAAEFVARLSPKLAVFVKYEWWLGYFLALDQRKIPSIVISAAFRQNQPFFSHSPLKHDYQKALFSIDHVFVQDALSSKLLNSIRHKKHSVSGDTRIDRTLSNRQTILDTPFLSTWAKKSTLVLVAGSTWIPDIELLAAALHVNPTLKIIVAPHEIDEKSIERTIDVLAEAVDRTEIGLYNQLKQFDKHEVTFKYRVVIIDSIGLLSKLYRLGHLAYIGGGFGAGIHNTLEAAVYGVPIAFGPNHEKFQEALALSDQKIATVVANAKDLSNFVMAYSETETRKVVLAKAEEYLSQNQGATQHIWDYLTERKLVS